MTSPFPTADLAQAKSLHGEGRLAEAQALYKRILTARPNLMEAVHGLALIAIDLGQPDRALPLLARCISAAPARPIYKMSLGLAYLRKGVPEEAAAHLLEAANSMPESSDARLMLAHALGAMNRWHEAHDVLQGAAASFPDSPQVWAAKGNAERVLGLIADAERSLQRALSLSPGDPDALNNLGVVVRAAGRTEEAVGYYREALVRAPDRATIHANMGNALTELRRNAVAEFHLQKAAALAPASAEVNGNLAAFLVKQDRPAEAVPYFRAALVQKPGNADAWTNLGVALLDIGDVKEAEVCYRKAIMLQPGNAEAHYNLAWVLLLTGQWQEGWSEYEWRWKLANFSSRRRTFTEPLWDGCELRGGALLMHAEQGLGDAIQFVRYARLARQRCARVVVECPKPLAGLFTGIAGVDEVVAVGNAVPPFDAQIPFMSLPRVFETTIETVPSGDAYIASPPTIPAHLRVPDNGRKRIGLVWAGSPDNKIDRRRRMPAALFAPLIESIDADVISLQIGPGAEQVADLPISKVTFICHDRVQDFVDTAAVLSQLDLIIGVDTAVMHLAGAMGRPVWMLLPYMPDYRWLLNRSDSPWYGSIHLFRREKSGDWAAPLEAIKAALTKL